MTTFTIAHTKAERERIALNLLQEYMRTEAVAQTPTDEMAGSLLRVLARTLVTFAVTLEYNGLTKSGGSVEDIADDLVSFLEEAVEIALLEYRALPPSHITPTPTRGNA